MVWCRESRVQALSRRRNETKEGRRLSVAVSRVSIKNSDSLVIYYLFSSPIAFFPLTKTNHGGWRATTTTKTKTKTRNEDDDGKT